MISLKKVLQTNAVFSITSGLLLVLFSKWTASEFGIDNHWIIAGIGDVLILYGIVIWKTIQDPERIKFIGWFASVNDVLWVDGSILLLILKPIEMSNIAIGLVIGSSVIVTDFAFFQLHAISKIPGVFTVSRIINAPTNKVWEVMSDIGGYYQYADGITSSSVILGEDAGTIRRCYNLKGESWTENCIEYIEGETYTMSVDTSDYPYPFTMFQGTWSVKENGNKTIATIEFKYLAKYWILGRLLMNRLFSKVAERDINSIFDSYEKEILAVKITPTTS